MHQTFIGTLTSAENGEHVSFSIRIDSGSFRTLLGGLGGGGGANPSSIGGAAAARMENPEADASDPAVPAKPRTGR